MSGFDALFAKAAALGGGLLPFGCADCGVDDVPRYLFPGSMFLGTAPTAGAGVNVTEAPFDMVVLGTPFQQNGGAQGANGPTQVILSVEVDGDVAFDLCIADIADNGPMNLEMAYAAKGNILRKGDNFAVRRSLSQALGAGGAGSAIGGYLLYIPGLTVPAGIAELMLVNDD